MAEIREVFPTLNDAGAGAVLDKKSEGNASTGNGSIGFSFKDSSGNVVLPQLNADGTIAVKDGAVGTCKNGSGTATATGGADDVVTLVLTLEKTYREIELSAGATQACLWTLVHIDDVGVVPTETELWRSLTGPGHFSVNVNFDCVEFNTIGGTGVQNLVLRGTQLFGNNTDLHCYLGCQEF